jgi:glycosyltransferase involved in cell wall biosynthesis
MSFSPTHSSDLPTVAVVIPTYNRPQYLRETLASVSAQDYPRLEIIVADDGSTDRPDEIDAACRAAGARLFRKAHSGGPDTRNQVLQTIDATWVLWLGDDDVLLPGVISSRVRTALAHPTADVIYADIAVADAKLRPTGQIIRTEEWFGRRIIPALFERNEITEGGSLVRRALIETAGGYNIAFPKAHDYEFWTRAAATAVFKRDPNIGYLWRWHGGNMGLGSGHNGYQNAHVGIILGLLGRFAPNVLFPDVPWHEIDADRTRGLLAFLAGARMVREDPDVALEFALVAAQYWPGVDASRLLAEVHRQRSERAPRAG